MFTVQLAQNNWELSNPRNPSWNDSEQTSMNVTIDHSEFGEIPMTVNAVHEDQHIVDIFNHVVAEMSATIVAFVPQSTQELQTIQLKEELEALKKRLVNTDYKFLPDYDQEPTQALIDERQAARVRIREIETELNALI